MNRRDVITALAAFSALAPWHAKAQPKAKTLGILFPDTAISLEQRAGKPLYATLRELGLEQIDEEVCLFRNDWLLVFFYVDDIVTLCRTEDLPQLYEFQDSLMEKYEMRYIR